MTPKRYAEYPPMRFRPHEFNDLLEYSSSYPTGTTAGKTWKRRVVVEEEGKDAYRWLIGQYADIPGHTDKIAMNWYRPVFRVQAVTRPHS